MRPRLILRVRVALPVGRGLLKQIFNPFLRTKFVPRELGLEGFLGMLLASLLPHTP